MKQLSESSHQGKSQFVTEVATISAVQHRNLVKLHGCCIDSNTPLLVYEYLENGSLDQAIFGEFHFCKLPAHMNILDFSNKTPLFHEYLIIFFCVFASFVLSRLYRVISTCVGHSSLNLDWAMRFEIILGIARGLSFLHEESSVCIVHRDIIARNILLDTDMNPKISDFGLAKLYDEKQTHVSTGIAGTL